jgi:hypothetical protein
MCRQAVPECSAGFVTVVRHPKLSTMILDDRAAYGEASKAAEFCACGMPGNAKNATELASSNPYCCAIRERLLGRIAGVEHCVK